MDCVFSRGNLWPYELATLSWNYALSYTYTRFDGHFLTVAGAVSHPHAIGTTVDPSSESALGAHLPCFLSILLSRSSLREAFT